MGEALSHQLEWVQREVWKAQLKLRSNPPRSYHSKERPENCLTPPFAKRPLITS
jgi:hypothetical protein